MIITDLFFVKPTKIGDRAYMAMHKEDVEEMRFDVKENVVFIYKDGFIYLAPLSQIGGMKTSDEYVSKSKKK